MIFMSSNWEDINRYYKNTYVKFSEMGEKLFFIRYVSPDAVCGVDEDHVDFELCLSDEHPYEVDFLLPHKSFFQLGKRAVALSRHPAKQYQRGLSDSNTRLYSLRSDGTTEAMQLGFDTLKAYVSKQKFPSLDEAIANKGRMTSTVLTSRIAYVPRSKGLYVDMVPIGEVDTTSKLIRLRSPIFVPELTEIANGSHFKVAQ